MKKYNLVNNALGWLCFVVAALTYLLTLEPTASFWDCPEFILQGQKLEVGHPPGNPIFMLAARFFINFAGSDVTKVAVAVNAMSALLSAGTILLLFWSITHLVKRLTVADDAPEVSLRQMIVIMGSGLCGALAYTWSDTFWFSAVEGEVYAFSSFCTALVFWLILKWERRADDPSSDRYLILIAYVIGISIAVHLLNLLCIPAVALVMYYRKVKDSTARGSLVTLGLAALVVALILYGLVPGFITVAQRFELACVNGLGMGYNMGVLIYAILLVASFVWTIRALYHSDPSKPLGMKARVALLLTFILSGIYCIGGGYILSTAIFAAGLVAIMLWKRLPLRLLNIAVISVMVIFAGYSSYALLLIRSTANPPMNQNSPDNVFDLASYLNREQYGERPLFYGETPQSSVLYQMTPEGGYEPVASDGPMQYGKAVKEDPSEPDRYVALGNKKNYKMTPELNMLFPRIYSGPHWKMYQEWTGMTGEPVEGTILRSTDGKPMRTETMLKPTQADNMRFFFGYQLNWMYWRYFLWNFAGRQNDIQGNGEPNHGNWISGIPFIDNARLGDQSLLPPEEGSGNAGHNVFYMLPLLMGLLGLGWQAFVSKRGIEQFWVVFFLFFMTGIAIVLYLNQTPGQVRERDYAYAGSFYAFAIWIGMGVAALASIVSRFLKGKKKEDEATRRKNGLIAAAVAALAGILVPLQMVSQTWDDHDRSGRTAARDFGMNYLNSLEPDAVIFCNGDNDTFPLWYAQEVEGVRTDVKVVNQSYLTTDWYADLMKHPYYDGKPLEMQARSTDYGNGRLTYVAYSQTPDTAVIEARTLLAKAYQSGNGGVITNPLAEIPLDSAAIFASGRLNPDEKKAFLPYMILNTASANPAGYMTLGNLLTLDILDTSMRQGWKRPVYFAMTVPEDYYVGATPYMRQTGMAYEISPVFMGSPGGDIRVDTDRSYDIITKNYLWGGLDKAKSGNLYLDETVRRMVNSVRLSMISTARALAEEGYRASLEADSLKTPGMKERAAERASKAREILLLLEEKLPQAHAPYSLQMPMQIAEAWTMLYGASGDKEDLRHAQQVAHDELLRMARYMRYYQSLDPEQYSRLQYTDRALDRILAPEMLSYYLEIGGDPEGIQTELRQMGVLERMLQNYTLYQQQQQGQ